MGSKVLLYKLDIKVNHEHDCGRFVLWNRQCADIIGICASELKNQMLAEGEDDPKTFLLVLDELLARTMVLRVKVQPSYNQLSLIRLSKDPNLIKKLLDQIGVFEGEEANILKHAFFLTILGVSLERENCRMGERGSPGRVKFWAILKDSRLSENCLA
ncbi:hypothetical protein Lal_00040213 [Lupinus albus]|nr:hypothetical protein Lal_00040213 [Lupinus albus]